MYVNNHFDSSGFLNKLFLNEMFEWNSIIAIGDAMFISHFVIQKQYL